MPRVAHDVFISYAHEDKPMADALCATLEQNGLRCWIAPRDVPLFIAAQLTGAAVAALLARWLFDESNPSREQIP